MSLPLAMSMVYIKSDPKLVVPEPLWAIYFGSAYKSGTQHNSTHSSPCRKVLSLVYH